MGASKYGVPGEIHFMPTGSLIRRKDRKLAKQCCNRLARRDCVCQDRNLRIINAITNEVIREVVSISEGAKLVKSLKGDYCLQEQDQDSDWDCACYLMK